MEKKFFTTKKVVIGLVAIALVAASATGVAIFLKDSGEASAEVNELQNANLPETGNNIENETNTDIENNTNNTNNSITNPDVPNIPDNNNNNNNNNNNSNNEGTTNGSLTRDDILSRVEETIITQERKVLEDLSLSWTTLTISALNANMSVYKPELTIDKNAVLVNGEEITENTRVRENDIITYEIKVGNRGNYKLTNVIVTDSLDVFIETQAEQTTTETIPAGEKIITLETLEAGKQAKFYVHYKVTNDDIIAEKNILNVAYATDGRTTVEDDAEVLVNPNVSVKGTKTWEDANNQDGIRPEKITVNLYANGEKIASQQVSAKENWQYAFDKLPKFNADNREFEYTIQEEIIAGYEAKVNGYDITNIHIPAKVTVSGTKTWNDANNQDGVRPASITVNLLANGKKVASKTVTARDNWTYTFTDLDKFENGKEIEYTVSEKSISKYETTVNGYNLTNTHAPEKTSISGKATWIDANNQDGIRPASITVNLFANGKKIDSKVVTAQDNWSYTFTNLDKFENGKEIVYTISEDEIEGYTIEITGYDITNTHIPAKVTVSGTKTWNDANNQDSVRPASITVNLLANGKKIDSKVVTARDNWAYTFTNLDKFSNGTKIVYTILEEAVEGYETTINGYNIINTHTPAKVTVSGTKTWVDANNQDGIRPASITVNLLANGKKVATTTVTANNNWKYSFKNLDKFINGTEIVYTISEEAIEGYTTEITGYDITNTHIPAKVTVSGTKTWVDANNQDGIRPAKILVHVLANGKKVQSRTVTANDNWSYTFTDLDKFSNETEIVYTVSEEAVAGYETTVNGYNLTNTHTPAKTTVSGTKTWIDNNNQSGKRPESITVNLLANGKKVASKTVTANNNWSYRFADLDKFSNGTEIVYTVSEEAVTGYETTIKGYNITNTIKQEKISVSGTKTWIVPEGTKVPDITIELYRDNQKIDSTVVKTTGTTATYTFNNLDKYDLSNGHIYNYTVKEIVPDKYVCEQDGTNFTNIKHITATKTGITSTGIKEVNIGDTINYVITISNNTNVPKTVTVKDAIQDIEYVTVNGDITLNGTKLSSEDVTKLYSGKLTVEMPANTVKTIEIPVKVTSGMTGNKITNTAYVDGEQVGPVVNPIERTVGVTKYKNNVGSTNIILVLDNSSSMSTSKIGNETRIQVAKRAITDFINRTYAIEANKDVTFTLVTFASRKYTEGKGGLFSFNDNGTTKTIATKDSKDSFITAIENLPSSSGTNMRAGLEVAYNTIYGENGIASIEEYKNYNKLVIFFGDGEPYGETTAPGLNTREGIKAMAQEIKDKGATVYSIGFGTDAGITSKGYPYLLDISSHNYVYTSLNYTELVDNFSYIISMDPEYSLMTVDGNACIQLNATSPQKIIVDDKKNKMIIKIGNEKYAITNETEAAKYGITYTSTEIIWNVSKYSKDTDLKISYHVQ